MNKDELEKYKQSLPPGVREDMKIGGQTEDHATNSLVLSAGMGGLIPAARQATVNLLRKEWGDRTLSDDVYQDWAQFGIEPKGLEGVNPYTMLIKPFTNKMRATEGTKAAKAALNIAKVGGAGLILHNLVNKYKPKKRK